MAIKVYRTTEQIPIKLGDVTLSIRPLSAGQRAEIQSMAELRGGEYHYKADKMTVAALRYSIRKVEGIEFSDGPLVADFDDNDMLTEDCIDAVFQACTNASLIRAAAVLMSRSMDLSHIDGIEVVQSDANHVPTKKKTKKR